MTMFDANCDPSHITMFHDMIILGDEHRTTNIHFMNIDNGQIEHTIQAGEPEVDKMQNYINSVHVSGDRLVTTTTLEKKMKIWDLNTKEMLHLIRTQAIPDQVAVSHDIIVTCSNSGGPIQVWNLDTGTLNREIPDEERQEYDCMTIHNDLLLVAGRNIIKIWNLYTDTVVNTITLPESSFVQHLGVMQNHIIAVGGCKIHIYDLATRELLHADGHAHRLLITNFAIDERHGRFMTSSHDKTAKLWNINGVLIKTFNIGRIINGVYVNGDRVFIGYDRKLEIRTDPGLIPVNQTEVIQGVYVRGGNDDEYVELCSVM